MKYNEILEEARACVGKGWWPILDKYLPQIVELAPDCDIIVKEKYGTLRIGAYGKALDHNKLTELERVAEQESATVCEECGAPGKLRNKLFRIQTLCRGCYRKAKRNKE